jgi:hypothetical protein
MVHRAIALVVLAACGGSSPAIVDAAIADAATGDGASGGDAAELDGAEPDAAAIDAAAVDAAAIDAAAIDAAAIDASVPDASASDASAPDAAAIDAAAPDAAEVDASPPDAAEADAPPPDASPPPRRALFAHLDGRLFRVDAATGVLTLVGATGLPAPTLVDAYWDPVAGVLRTISDAYGAPRWSTIDLCTAAVTHLGPVTLDGVVRDLEGLARLDDGTVRVVGDTNNSNNNLCERVARLDPTTRAATSLTATVDTLQDDLDQLEWTGALLYGLDVWDAGGATGLYRVDPATGATTLVTTTAVNVRRLAWDVDGARMFATTNDNPRRLVTLDLTTGALAAIGPTHTAAEYGGFTMDMIFFAPEPTCP